MKKPLIAFTALALIASAAVAPQAQAQSSHRRQVCENVEVRHSDAKDQHQIAGTAIGAVAGGVLGHQVGGGKGKTLATVAGAVGGGYAGNRIQKNNQDKNSYTTTERRCHYVDD
ncbi:glycine zipper 2TM protein [Luteibacter rhizovicinus]|uniref:Glycine zipper 2TM protein n=1 Tax=Luteibacter rhizovicinus TaxID=242606 RepID=A0A4R3YSE3_9GAMM|nr:glycine zipper 2TM domain-containing protein [Luteibacter rhizovicinus]TCV95915.1 glycine zipper 2TM protein [Luteibacter rhizovicinus]